MLVARHVEADGDHRPQAGSTAASAEQDNDPAGTVAIPRRPAPVGMTVTEHRPENPATSRARILAYPLGAALLVATGSIHLVLALTTYGGIPTIGTLFLGQAATSLGLAVALLALRRPLIAAAGALLLLATLGGYLLALLVGLFGFREVLTGAGVAAAVVEIAGATVLTAAAAPALRIPAGTRRAAPAVVAALALGATVPSLATSGGPGGVARAAGGGPVVEVVHLPRFGAVLADHRGYTLYVLSIETGGRIVCRGGCLSIWPPLLVPGSVRRVVAPHEVGGHLGLVARPGGVEQVTDNGYPLYTYAGDGQPRQAAGEGIDSFGGVWYLVSASASSPRATPLRQR